jgi:ribosomal protein S18 acetylase RimI-like enzyme
MTVVGLLARRARVARDDARVLCVSGVTVVVFEASPPDAGNRAYELSGSEVAVIAEVAGALRAEGRSPLLEIDASTISGSARAAMASLGLAMRWVTVELRRDLAVPVEAPTSGGVVVRRAREDEAEAVGVLAREAFDEPTPGLPRIDHEHVRRSWAAYCHSRDARVFVAELDGAARAVGFSLVDGDVALVDGAATLPAYRRRGCQSALRAHRFADAKARGARVAVTRAAEGSASQANLERAGMRVARRFEVWGEPH